MKKFIGPALFTLTLILSLPGCGSSEPTNIAADAEQTAIEEYEAAMKAEQEAMNAEPPADL
jgi:hypothetical protein